MNDAYARYMQGMKNLRAYLQNCNYDQQIMNDAELFHMRLKREISEAQQFGGDSRDREVNKILNEIIAFSQEHTGKSFNDHWCEMDSHPHPSSMPSSSERDESAPDISPSIQSNPPEQTAPGPPPLLPPIQLPSPLQTYIREMFTLLQKTQPLVEQDRIVYPHELAPIRQLLQQNNRGISPEMIADSIKPISFAHTNLVVAVNHVKKCTEEITKLLSDFEVACQRSTGKKQRRSLQEKLDTTLYYMQQSLSFALS